MTPQFVPPAVDLGVLLPFVIVSATAMIVLLVGLFAREDQPLIPGLVGLVGLALALVATLGLAGSARSTLNGTVVADNLFVFFASVSLIVAGLVIILSLDYFRKAGREPGDYYALLLFSTAGAVILASAADLILVILGIELLSIALYVLAAFRRGYGPSEEAAMKYFLLGAFSLGFLIYGASFVYGATGSTAFANIASGIASDGVGGSPLLLLGLGLLLVGFAFKLSFVPFHMWTPDVYEGAPTAVAAFMSVGTKVAVFAALARLLAVAFPALRADWEAILWGLAILTMVLGNVAAVVQTSIKRMLAYSSIAQAGYILVALVAGDRLGLSGVMFYLLAYAFMNVGAFAVVLALGPRGDEEPGIQDLAGLYGRSPLLAVAMTIFMLSLAGIPPTAGFIAKLYVFTAAIRAGFVDLAVIGVLTSAIAAFYYLRILVAVYMQDATETAPLRLSAPLSLIVLVTVFFTLQLGILPALPVDWAQSAVALAAHP